MAELRIFIVACMAAWLGLRQAEDHRLLGLLRWMEEDRVRKARKIVIDELSTRRDEKWWELKDQRFHDAAALVASIYDHLGGYFRLTLKFHDRWFFSLFGKDKDYVWKFFIDRWGEGIVRSYEILKRYIDYRREKAPKSYEGYEWVYKEAKQRHPLV